MIKLSANLGFLWNELSLPDAIRAAKKAGFDAVECHWPYDTPAQDILAVLNETELKMLGLNTVRGDVEKGENGLSALVGRQKEARAAIDQAIEYAVAIGAPNIHVMAGFAKGEAAHNLFVENLQYACERASLHSFNILIEPLNRYDAPNYFLQTSGQAINIIEDVGADNIKLMFDCYHLQIMEGNISRRLVELKPFIGHIQIASVPLRQEPNIGELDYKHIFNLLSKNGFDQPIGAEYKPATSTDDGLGWIKVLNS